MVIWITSKTTANGMQQLGNKLCFLIIMIIITSINNDAQPVQHSSNNNKHNRCWPVLMIPFLSYITWIWVYMHLYTRGKQNEIISLCNIIFTIQFTTNNRMIAVISYDHQVSSYVMRTKEWIDVVLVVILYIK